MALSAQAQAAYLAAAQSNPAVKRIVSVATERCALSSVRHRHDRDHVRANTRPGTGRNVPHSSAIRDIIQSIVDRSAKIAAIATREMVLKDFAMEPDENKMRKAAHLMVQSLASSLALVAYKDPLRARCVFARARTLSDAQCWLLGSALTLTG